MLGGLGGAPAAPSGPPSITAFEQQGLKVTFSFEKPSPSMTIPAQPYRSLITTAVVRITVTSTNSTGSPLDNYVFQAAVPKAFTIALEPQSSSTVPPSNSGSVTQVAVVQNPQQVCPMHRSTVSSYVIQQPLRMRLLINFSANGSPVTMQGQVDNFPSGV